MLNLDTSQVEKRLFEEPIGSVKRSLANYQLGECFIPKKLEYKAVLHFIKSLSGCWISSNPNYRENAVRLIARTIVYLSNSNAVRMTWCSPR